MQALQTITQVTKTFGVSTRMLRYYEEIGLLQSRRIEGYSYRVYDDEACSRLRQIITLRKLRISLRQIAALLADSSAAAAIGVFTQSIGELDEEIRSLSTIRSILEKFVDELRERSGVCLKADLLGDTELFSVAAHFSLKKFSFREDRTMEELTKASESISKLKDKDVRIVYLPPATVAAIQCTGGAPETESGNLLREFIKAGMLAVLKPDFRHYGFNHPNGEKPDGSDHGYERWVTIPEDMEVAAPFVKKQFKGGLYAAHMIPMGAFEEWNLLCEWGANNDKYEIAWGSPECMGGLLEEHLNYINLYMRSAEELDRLMQLDLLLPIREKNASAAAD